MTKSGKRSARSATPPANADTLAAFEKALALLSRHDQAPAGTNLPALPLPSLLERCEDMLARQDRPAGRMRLLLCFPGLAPLSPDWWRNRVTGIGCVRVSVSAPDLGAAAPDTAGERRAVEAMLEGLGAELAQEGRDLLVTAETGDLLPAGPWAHSLLLVCHPATAYRAVLRRSRAPAPALDRFCDDLLDVLAAHSDRPWQRIEDLGDSSAAVRSALCRQLEIRQPAGLDAVDMPGAAPAAAAAPVTGTGGYQRLCARLGYDPVDVPPLPAEPPAAAGHRPAARHDPDRQPALVSEFLQRLDRVRALAPDGGRDQALMLQSGTDITALLDSCLSEGEENLLDRLDAALETLLPADAALLLFACASHFKARGQRLQALSFVAEGLTQAGTTAQGRWLQVLGAALYADLGAADQALTALLSDVLASGVLTAPARDKLAARLESLTRQQQEPEHGHALLIERLTRTPPPRDGRKRLMVEIGTTREQVAGQGSTLKLAQLCTDLGLDFVTVDMDPRNTRQAQMMFRRNGFAFSAITARGEDYLAGFDGEIDYVFLDAYDFDHGKHSDLRQSRYERFLGSRIEESQCHQMHLDCVTALVDKLAPDGLICFDDTWQDETGAWTAKGTTAMPFLLEHGFEIIAARNNAALLRRAMIQD